MEEGRGHLFSRFEPESPTNRGERCNFGGANERKCPGFCTLRNVERKFLASIVVASELINSCLARLSPIPHCQKCPCLMIGPFRISFSLRRPKSQGKIPKTRCTKGSCVESSQPPPSPLHQTLTWPDFASAQKGGGKGSLFHVDQRPFFERGGLAVWDSPLLIPPPSHGA